VVWVVWVVHVVVVVVVCHSGETLVPGTSPEFPQEPMTVVDPVVLTNVVVVVVWDPQVGAAPAEATGVESSPVVPPASTQMWMLTDAP